MALPERIEPRSNGVHGVLLGSDVFKVVETVVPFVSVNVVHLQTGRTRTKKSSSDDTMNL